MLTNRLLRNSGYIFIQNVDPLYIKMIIDIGSYPIFTYIHNNCRYIYTGDIFNKHNCIRKGYDVVYAPHKCSLFNFSSCTISDIKYILNKLTICKRYYPYPFSVNELFYEFPIMYFT